MIESGAGRESVRGLGWPTEPQRLLLSVLISEPVRARDAWLRWRGSARLERLEAASRRLLPLALQRFDELGLDDPELQRLRGMARHTWVSNHLHVRAGLEAAAALNRAGMRVCALKGLALLEHDYAGDFSTRPMYDADLLVPRERAGDAAVILESLGFAAEPPITRETLATRGVASGVAHAFRRGHTSVDLHWHVLHQDRSRFFDSVGWSHAVPLRHASSEDLLILAPTEHLMHVCLHGARHDAAANRIWPLDAVRLLERPGVEIDWARLIESARRRCLSVALLDTFELLATLTPAMPRAVLARLAAEPVSALELLEYRGITGAWHELEPGARRAVLRMSELRCRYEVLTPELLRAVAG
jgi:hypothetical protein